MKLRRESWYSVLALAAVLGAGQVVYGCGSDSAPDDASEADGGAAGAPSSAGGANAGSAGTDDTPLPPYTPAGDEVQNELRALPNWAQPPANSETLNELADDPRKLDVDGHPQDFICKQTEHDIVADHDQILNFDIGSQYVLPGLILQGGPFQTGELAPIPFAPSKRAPIKLYVSVAGTENASEIADPPSTSGITNAVAKLQQRAQMAAGDNFAAKVSYSKEEVQSLEQLTVSLGVDFHYSNAFADVGFQAAFDHQDSVEKHTVVMKLQQDMYTVSFAYDEFMRSADFFTNNLTADDVTGLKEDGYLSNDNQPVFISSVTYGRMVIFTATSTKSESATQISQALQASYDSKIGGSSSISETAAADAKQTLSNLEIKVLAIGGNSDSVSSAIQAGDWDALFSKPDILSAVPLRYVVRSLTGNRPVARIGDTTKFTVSECALVPKTQGWVAVNGPDPQTAFSDVTSNERGDTWALGRDSTGTTALYHYIPPSGVGDKPAFQKKMAWDGIDISVDSAGYVFGVNNAPPNNSLSVLAPGANSWTSLPGVPGALGVESGPAGTVYMTNLYSDGQRDLRIVDRTKPTAAAPELMDEGQCITALPFSFGMLNNKTVFLSGWDNNGLKICGSISNCYQCGGDVYGSRLTQVSGANDSEIWVVDASNQILKFNNATLGFDKFDTALTPPNAIKKFEAGGNSDHWILTQQDRLFHYVPPTP